jgi:hypothetical protein
MTSEKFEVVEVTFLHLSWDDILFQHVLPFLNLKDCFSLRCTSKLCRELVDSYFTIIKNVDIAILKTFNGPAFKVSWNENNGIGYLRRYKQGYFCDGTPSRKFFLRRMQPGTAFWNIFFWLASI